MTTLTIAAQAQALADQRAGRPVHPAMEVLGRDQVQFEASYDPAGVIKPGAAVADAPLVDALGVATSLYDVVHDQAAVIVFYRGAWCPYCNIALRTYQEALLPQLQSRGLALVALSPQKPDGSLSMQEKLALTFPVMTDSGNAVAAQLGIVRHEPAEVLSTRKGIGLDLADVNAQDTVSLPLPTVVIIDAQHVVRWIDVHLAASSRTEVGDILAAVDALGSQSTDGWIAPTVAGQE